MMFSNSQRTLLREKGTLLGRVLMGLLFFFSGAGILMSGVAGTASFYEGLGVPMAGAVVWLVVLLKLGAGGSLMLGFRTGLAATALIVFTIVATLLAHLSLEDINLFKNLAIIGGLLYILAYGPGDGWSLDKKETDTVTI